MSRYYVDKLLREMLLDPGAREQFLADPAAYLAGHDLTDPERQALVVQDYGALYALGAHPFLLWGWTTRVHRGDKERLRDVYAEAVRPYGYPDFGT